MNYPAPRDSIAMFEYGIRVTEWAKPGTIVAVDLRVLDGSQRFTALGPTPFSTAGRYVVMAHPQDAARTDFRWACLDALAALLKHQQGQPPRPFVAPDTDPAVDFSEHTHIRRTEGEG